MASLGFPLWLRLSHYINLLFIGLLIRSGIEILGAHPRLYWNDACTPAIEWIKFTKKRVPTEKGVIYTARDDEVAISFWLALSGCKNLELGRHWHGITNTFWLLNGIIYIVLLFATDEWARLIPTSWDIFPRAWHSLLIYLSFQIPPLSDFHPYAVAIAIIALLLVLGIYLWTTWYSLRHKRQVQIALDHIETPIRTLALHNLASGQRFVR
jgi:methionine sulfoxide reductase catalytic subunit